MLNMEKLDRKISRWSFRYPILSLCCMFFTLPMFILLAVAICAVVVAVPICLIFDGFNLIV